MNEFVSISGLKGLANILNGRREELKSIFEGELIPTLNECKTVCNINEVAYMQIYNNIINKLGMLANILDGSISHDYQELVENLNDIFNGEFTTTFNNLMNSDKEE